MFKAKTRKLSNPRRQDEDDSGYLRLEITNVASFFSREMMTSPDDAFRFPYGTSPMASPGAPPATVCHTSPDSLVSLSVWPPSLRAQVLCGTDTGRPSRKRALWKAGEAALTTAIVPGLLPFCPRAASTPARSPAPGSPAASGANQAFADARMRGLSLEDALAAGAAVGPEVVEEACVVNSPTSARAHLASDDAEADAEEGQDSVPAELGSGGKGKGGLLSGSASLSRPLAHETSLGGWNSLGDMLAHDSSAEKQQQQQQHAVQEGGEGEAKEPSTPEPMRARPSDGPEGHSSGGVPGPGGPGFTFSAPETASPPMLAAFGWSPTAQKVRARRAREAMKRTLPRKRARLRRRLQASRLSSKPNSRENSHLPCACVLFGVAGLRERGSFAPGRRHATPGGGVRGPVRRPPD